VTISRIAKLFSDQGGRGLELDPSRPNGRKTPIQLVVEGGYDEILQMILDIDGTAFAQHEAYLKAIRSAASRGHESSVGMLLEKGHDLKVEQKYTQPLRDLIQLD